MTATLAADRTPYDDVPYDSFPFPQTHPERLATLGQLFGMRPPALANCRVLELGCAAGGNLVPMALAMPRAQFVGVDLSAVQVAQGQRLIDALGLRNIRLYAMSIADVDETLGSFDYIVSHGVYSWVPNAVQEKMLAICAAQLSADGIAYISYNTLPGWRLRGTIRDLMRYHALQFPDPAERVGQARAILDFLARSVPTADNAYGMLLKSELDVLRGMPDYYILHEHLEETNEPLYFHQFAERAARHGLQYLAEAELTTMLASNLAPAVQETVLLIASDVIRQEQFMDFLRNRSFRQTLLVRSDRPLDRTLTPERVTTLWAAAALLPVAGAPDFGSDREEAFRAPGGGLLKTANAATKAATVLLASRWPAAMAFGDLLREVTVMLGPAAAPAAAAAVVPMPGIAPISGLASTLASDLLQCHAAGLLELHAGPSGFVTRHGPLPFASPLARWQAAQSMTRVTTLRHEVAQIDAHLGRLLQLLDGTRDLVAIRAAVLDWSAASANGANRQALASAVHDRVDRALDQIARSALLLA